jgi:hypothetical protein
MQNPPINNLDYKARRVLILGVSRTGKSTLMARLIYTHPAPLVLVYDWQGGEFAKRLGAVLATDREMLAKKIDEGHRIVCYDAEAGEHDPQGGGFEWWCEMVFELAGQTPGRKLVVIDECQDLIDPYNLPTQLGDILSRGGRRMIDTCIAGRSANALQTEARDQVTELYVFRCLDANSLKYPTSLGLDAETIQGLPDTHFIFKNMRTGQQNELALWAKKSISREKPVT